MVLRQVTQITNMLHTLTANDAVCDDKHVDAGGEDADDEGDDGQQRAGHRNLTAREPLQQHAHDGTCMEGHAA